MRILGLDPSLTSTGWGVVEVNGNRLQYVADGFIPTNPKMPIEERLELIFKILCTFLSLYLLGREKEKYQKKERTRD